MFAPRPHWLPAASAVLFNRYTLALVSVADGDGCTGFTQPVTAQEVTQALRDTNDLITECSYRKMTINPRQLTVSGLLRSRARLCIGSSCAEQP